MVKFFLPILVILVSCCKVGSVIPELETGYQQLGETVTYHTLLPRRDSFHNEEGSPESDLEQSRKERLLNIGRESSVVADNRPDHPIWFHCGLCAILSVAATMAVLGILILKNNF